jgi:hypothetical protein
VSNTLISDNGADGISIDPMGSGAITGGFDNVKMGKNGDFGLDINSTTQPINVTMSDSVSSNNLQSGVNAVSLNGTAQINVMVRNSTIANNKHQGASARCRRLNSPDAINDHR